MRLILASTSLYRQQLLKKLELPFEALSPVTNEQPIAGEPPQQRALRLAIDKAKSIAHRHPDALVIGSDQVACVGSKILRKPGSSDKAVQQLRASSGKAAVFYTGLAVYQHRSDKLVSHVEPYKVQFRTLTDVQIQHYVDKEQPLDCAGSFKSEGLGIALFEKLEGRDPNALIGLPLIALCEALREFNLDPLA